MHVHDYERLACRSDVTELRATSCPPARCFCQEARVIGRLLEQPRSSVRNHTMLIEMRGTFLVLRGCGRRCILMREGVAINTVSSQPKVAPLSRNGVLYLKATKEL
ncbi:hypothetical protein EYF80_043031 [Liparis tanakae]|uniref:Uncharacterized protein n=1 Tax=Liparis tanakae TaxID=230148 RepID=A0A4Z2FZU6_9TELE|nr:hypothetical protein EYF80_043031 [Liparis tanakae]